MEGLTADELRRMGMAEVRAENGRVFCQGEPKDIPRLNLRLRTGERVLLQLGAFPARSFEELFQGVLALPWEDFIPKNGRFPVKGYSLNSALHSVPACQSIVKKAAATRLGRAYRLETLPEDGALYQIQFSLMKDQAALLLDTTGPGLYKRGYRAVGVRPPSGRPWPPPWCCCPATGDGTPSVTPSAARAPSPSRPPSSPRTGPRG